MFPGPVGSSYILPEAALNLNDREPKYRCILFCWPASVSLGCCWGDYFTFVVHMNLKHSIHTSRVLQEDLNVKLSLAGCLFCTSMTWSSHSAFSQYRHTHFSLYSPTSMCILYIRPALLDKPNVHKTLYQVLMRWQSLQKSIYFSLFFLKC